jgi:hypothetical protein
MQNNLNNSNNFDTGAVPTCPAGQTLCHVANILRCVPNDNKPCPCPGTMYDDKLKKCVSSCGTDPYCPTVFPAPTLVAMPISSNEHMSIGQS